MTRTDLIKRAIESAECRLYKVRARDSYSIEHQQKAENQTELMNITIEALEKQIPIKPYFEGDGYWNGEIVYDTWACPYCGIYYETGYEEYDYCPNCGQAIKWEDHE